jgi:hypothetical protein
LLKNGWPRPLWGLGGLGIRSGPCSQGTESDQIIALLPDLQICKFVKAYAHNPVRDAVAAFSHASSETTGVGVSTILAGRFLALLFFGVRLRLILVFFAFRFLAMSLPLDFISDKIVVSLEYCQQALLFLNRKKLWYVFHYQRHCVCDDSDHSRSSSGRQTRCN